MSGPFKMNGWKAYTKVKDKPIKPSTTKTGSIVGEYKDTRKSWQSYQKDQRTKSQGGNRPDKGGTSSSVKETLKKLFFGSQ